MLYSDLVLSELNMTKLKEFKAHTHHDDDTSDDLAQTLIAEKKIKKKLGTAIIDEMAKPINRESIEMSESNESLQHDQELQRL